MILCVCLLSNSGLTGSGLASKTVVSTNQRELCKILVDIYKNCDVISKVCLSLSYTFTVALLFCIYISRPWGLKSRPSVSSPAVEHYQLCWQCLCYPFMYRYSHQWIHELETRAYGKFCSAWGFILQYRYHSAW